MSNLVNGNKDDAGQRRRFILLCSLGATVMLLGILAPLFITNTPPESPREPAKEASTKVLPPAGEKKSADGNGEPVGKQPLVPALPPSEATSLSAILTRLVFGTLFVLLLCAGTAYGVGRWMKGKNLVATSGPLKLIASLSINARCSIFLVQAGDQHLVAGVDATGLRTMLHLPGEFEPAEEVEEAARVESVPALSEPSANVFAGRIPILRPVSETSRMPN